MQRLDSQGCVRQSANPRISLRSPGPACRCPIDHPVRVLPGRRRQEFRRRRFCGTQAGRRVSSSVDRDRRRPRPPSIEPVRVPTTRLGMAFVRVRHTRSPDRGVRFLFARTRRRPVPYSTHPHARSSSASATRRDLMAGALMVRGPMVWSSLGGSSTDRNDIARDRGAGHRGAGHRSVRRGPLIIPLQTRRRACRAPAT